ncbi:hypothetical protein K6Y81_40500, partial [Burkholderia cenocepacia]|nr:hypothetical protein [Burkholderia cenocepacia]
VSPWSVYDIAEFFSRGFAKWWEGHERRKEERFVKQEEKARQKAEKEARLEQEETEKTLLDLVLWIRLKSSPSEIWATQEVEVGL